MTCPSCSHANPDGARFCNGCGAALALHCPGCGTDNPPASRFCNACGGSLTPRSAAAVETRKVVTIVFADLIGSTSLHERLDPESVSRLMDRYYQVVRGPIEAHGGTVVTLLGDGVLCAFGVPRVGEDDAIRAVRAAVGMQDAFREFAREHRDAVGHLGLRVALNTGEVVVSDEHRAGIGDPLNVAARLQQEAHDGDVVIGEATQRLVSALVTVAPFGTFALKGRSEPVTAYRVLSLERPAGAAASVFVGRDEELGRLLAVYEAAVAAPRARLAVLLGSPGLGKSRLIAELGHRFGQQATVLTAQCDAAGGATFAPIANALRTLLTLDDAAGTDAQRAAIAAVIPDTDAERARIAGGITALLAGTPASPEETFFVIRRLLAGLAATKPVVLAIDDLQWAEPLLLDLTEHLVQWSTDVPLLVLVAARPELRDTRSSLVTPGGLVSDVVTLGGLDAAAATRLAASVIGADALPAAIAGRVLATSEGNPLFVGELVRMLVHDGALKREGDRWTTGIELAALEMPPTIQALLAARIERLRPEERTVLERAAVVGRQFSRAAVGHLLPRELHGELDTRLESLRRSELIEPDAGWFLGEPVLRFHHVLIRDAAYRRVLKGTRAELHGRFADWVETKVGEAVEHDETIGWHLEQAHQHLRELGPLDAQGRAFGDRASRYLAAAGRRALARDDLPLAGSLLGRALDRLDATDPGRADLALDWCEALLAAGDVGPAAGAVAELGRYLDGSDRLRAWHTCFAGQLAALTDPQTLRTTADAVAIAAEELAAAGDSAGEAKAHSVHAIALQRLGKVGACEAALDKALAAARRAHDRRRANAVLAGAPLAALWGPSPVTRASGRCLDVVRVLRITQGAPAVEAVALRCQAVLEALRGRGEAARRMIASSRRMVEELGITQQLLEADVFAGLIDLLEGDAVAAERSLRDAYEGLRDHGLGIDAARAGAFLGRALLAQDRAAEAEALSHDSEALAGDDLQAAITWRGVRAEALARRGGSAEAVELARAAVDIAAATDALLHHADARLALGVALRAAGRPDEAAAEEKRAIELWEAKGAAVLVESARRAGGRASPVERVPDERREPASRVRRRVAPNAATAHVACINAAVTARDVEALSTLVSELAEVVHHPTGTVYGRDEALAFWRTMIDVQPSTFRHDPLATLGDSLALFRHSLSASGIADGELDVGSWQADVLPLIEVDAQGRSIGVEVFAAERLGDAVVRLYERYADILPDGPARARAAATARSVAALLEPGRWQFAPDAEAIDHRTVGFGSLRGGDAVLQAIRALLELSDDFATRMDDVLALRSDALLVHWTTSGTLRVSGGAFERNLLMLWIFGPDGLLTRWEQFDADRDTQALARFDEAMGETPLPRLAAAPSRTTEQRERRVRPNAATALAARVHAAILARDADALPALLADEFEVVDHTTGVVYDGQGYLATFRVLLKAEHPRFASETLATLGDSLALFRESTSASGFVGRTFDVGAYDKAEIALNEVDAQGRQRRAERFAPARLGDAVVRLYERYADLIPDGPARTRAAATARTVATWLGPPKIKFLVAVLAPAVEYVDHRLVGFPSTHGAEAFRDRFHSLIDVAVDVANRIDDVLGLRSNTLLVLRTTSGTDRAYGGAFERQFLQLLVFGTDGLISRCENFDAERAAEAFARFDELTAEPAAVRIAAAPSRAVEKRERRVRSNAATANAARVDSAIARRDADALPTLLAEEVEIVHHPTGAVYDRRGLLVSWRSLLSARDPSSRHEPLATLGDSLALSCVSTSASSFVGGTFDVGAYETERLYLLQVDANGRQRRAEVFAADRLGDAVARLYQRYADLLPDGPACARAAATAHSVAVLLEPLDPDRVAEVLSPSAESEDHRKLVGLGSTRGKDAIAHNLRAMAELTKSFSLRIDDLLALRTDGLLIRTTNSGKDRAGGGAFEREFLRLWTFGADGLLTHTEWFDFDHDAEALARFDELTAETPLRLAAAPSRAAERRVRPNAATASVARLDAAMAARDADAVSALLADEYEVEQTTGDRSDRDAALAHFHSFLRVQDLRYEHQALATLGSSLALFRGSVSGSGVGGRNFDVGAFETETVVLREVDAQGRLRRTDLFPANRLGDAVARLYERYADLLPDGPARTRAAATARSAAALMGPYDPDQFATAFAPAIEVVDHRILGTWSSCGAQALLQSFRSWFELADDMVQGEDEVLSLQSDAFLARRTFFGTDRTGGGAFERPFIQLWLLGSDGLLARLEFFDIDRESEALARFDELTGETPPRRFAAASPRAPEQRPHRVRPNAATANAARIDAAIAARDADAIADLFADESEAIDHPTGATFGRQGVLTTWQGLLRAQDGTCRHEALATLGDSLALCRQWRSGSGFTGKKFDVGAYETETIVLVEVDAHGRRLGTEVFAADRLSHAIVRLYERYADLLPDGPARARAAATARSVAAYHRERFDPDRLAAVHAPDIEAVDHRILGNWFAHGAEAFLRQTRSWLDVADDLAARDHDILALEPGALLVRRTFFGVDRVGGGAFERPFIYLAVFGPDGLLARWETFDVDRDADALARFDELTGETPPPRLAAAPPRTAEKRARRVRPNAATASADRLDAAVAARDVDAVLALLADDMEGVDHPTGLDYDRQGSLAMWRSLMSNRSRDFTYRQEPLATLGDSLALNRFSWSASGFSGGRFDVGPYETEQIVLIEVDPRGRRRRTEAFAADHLGAAVVRLYERYAELLADGPARARAAATACSVAAVQSRLRDPDRFATALALDVEWVDHQPVGFPSVRGAEALMRGLRSLIELTDENALRLDDVLGLRADAILERQTSFGTLRASGGAFERHFLVLWVFGADGLLTRLEWFAADREDEALARFDELTAEPPAALLAAAKPRRRVRPNAATANVARQEAAIAARDVDRLDSLLADDMQTLDHNAGSEWGREGALFGLRSLLRADDLKLRIEPLATLGDALALCRWSVSASGLTTRDFDVGAYETESINLFEVDGQGRRRRNEIFAAARVGDAVARLYERYAELLPDGPERARATATARSVAMIVGPLDRRRSSPKISSRSAQFLDRYGTAFAPTIEFVDHRSVGFGSVHGAEALLRAVGALLELTDNVANRIDDILVIRPDALLVRWTNFGTDRAGGGTYERPVLIFFVFGPDGLATHGEQFDVDREDEALARFDELTGETPPPRLAAAPSRSAQKGRRRVRPNAATANTARIDAAFAARDADACLAVFAEGAKSVHHPTGAEWDEPGSIRTLRSLLSAKDPTFHNEPLATLGESLALCRLSWSASGLTSEKFDVGAYEGEEIILIEVDGRGQRTHAEMFATDRLGDAIARLYERNAELLPDGPARDRATATARVVAALLAPFDPDLYATAYAPAIEVVDHRTLGTWSARGAEAMRQHWLSMLEIADDVAMREDDILALRSNAFLGLRTHYGTDRAGGGAYERPFLWLALFRNEGLVSRIELFESDHEAEALARFDELAAEPAARPVRRRVRANAATAQAARTDAAIAARDAAALPALCADELEVIEHPTGVTFDRQGQLRTFRALLKAQNPAVASEPLATLGDSLALCRVSTSASGFVGRAFDVGAYEKEEIELNEVDAQGRQRRREAFAADRLGDAVARLYERYADLLPDGPARTRAVATARSVAVALGPVDPERYASALAPAIEVVDHRTLGTWSARGAEEVRQHFRALSEVAEDVAICRDEILGLEPDALLMRQTHSGTARAGGGAYERPFIWLVVFGPDGLQARAEYFDVDRADDALARFDELIASTAEGSTARPAPAPFENAATRLRDPFVAAWAARDWEGIAALFAPDFRLIDRRRYAQFELNRDQHLESLRFRFEMSSSRTTIEVKATRGRRLALVRQRFELAGGDVGPSETESLNVAETDERGHFLLVVAFDPDDLDAAFAELDQRYADGEAAVHSRVAVGMRAFVRAIATWDWDAMSAVLSPDLVVTDHRPLGWETMHGPAMYVASLKSLVELAPDARLRGDHMLLSDRAALFVNTWVGTREGGAFEAPRALVFEFDAAGHIRSMDFYDPEQLAEARACFEAVGGIE